MKIVVFGMGGVGGFVGGALARIHPETCFFARGDNLDVIRSKGLKVESVILGDFTAHPALASDNAAELGVADIVILSCKGYDLASACAAMAPMVGPSTVVLPLLNGVMVSEQMAPLLPPCILADGTIHVFSHTTQPGCIRQYAGQGAINLGLADGGRPPILQQLTDLLNQAGVKTVLTDNILQASWEKYLVMGSNSTVYCYYDGPAGTVRQDPNHERVLRAMIGVALTIASTKGVVFSADRADRYVAEFEGNPPDTMTSLYRDLNSGKPADKTELVHIIGRMVQLARQAGVSAPYHSAVLERYGITI